jgi:cellulose synthase/poly-beta-1,6-N-acetylglucosamine synthase-like glycosyltransferase
MIIEFLIILGSIWLIGWCCVVSLWIIIDTRAKKRIFPSYTPVVSIIVPCKGTDYGFQENTSAYLTQEYPRYQTTFVVASKDDPAYSALDQLTKNKPNAHLTLTNPCSGCSAKVASLLTGLASTAEAEVLVFGDSDMRPDTRWLQNLVAPLQDETVGATTGYWWYFPTNWKTLLFSVWNMISIVGNFYPTPAWASGGSTAIQKNVFEKLHIKDKWKTAISDDNVLSAAVKKAGYTIYFQPKCIVESPPETSIRRFMRWGTKEFTLLRWYHPVLWLGAFFGFVGAPIIALGLLVVFLFFGYYIPGILLSSFILFEILFGWLGIHILPKRMAHPKERYSSKIGYALMTPVAFLLIAQNVIASAITKEIQWAGRSYRKPKNLS